MNQPEREVVEERWNGKRKRGLQAIVQPSENTKNASPSRWTPFFQLPYLVHHSNTVALPFHIDTIAVGLKCSLGINIYYCLQFEQGTNITHIQYKWKSSPRSIRTVRACIGIHKSMRMWKLVRVLKWWNETRNRWKKMESYSCFKCVSGGVCISLWYTHKWDANNSLDGAIHGDNGACVRDESKHKSDRIELVARGQIKRWGKKQVPNGIEQTENVNGYCRSPLMCAWGPVCIYYKTTSRRFDSNHMHLIILAVVNIDKYDQCFSLRL